MGFSIILMKLLGMERLVSSSRTHELDPCSSDQIDVEGCLKINVDAACSPFKDGMGMWTIIRNHNGDGVAAATEFRHGCYVGEGGEIFAFLYSLWFAFGEGDGPRGVSYHNPFHFLPKSRLGLVKFFPHRKFTNNNTNI
ncbi:hypothetical protein Csa_011364 [Cucumis sativus]|uniref:RNase H type-1 domain-containing protein n=1 Tax=Cucumis sativus TaxID=3659 RepID=A0A0A0L999_CUCSA|nr:hypothetical protein Csa_011364 [Cucumis sativus]